MKALYPTCQVSKPKNTDTEVRKYEFLSESTMDIFLRKKNKVNRGNYSTWEITAQVQKNHFHENDRNE